MIIKVRPLSNIIKKNLKPFSLNIVYLFHIKHKGMIND